MHEDFPSIRMIRVIHLTQKWSRTPAPRNRVHRSHPYGPLDFDAALVEVPVRGAADEDATFNCHRTSYTPAVHVGVVERAVRIRFFKHGNVDVPRYFPSRGAMIALSP